MNNGCVCCTVRGDLIRTVEGLMRRPGRFDAILVETTGLADPVPVAQTFFMDDDVRAKTKLDAVVALVDAKHLPLRLKDSAARPRTRSPSPTSSCSTRPISSRPEELRRVEGDRPRHQPDRPHPPHRARRRRPDQVLDRGAFDLKRARWRTTRISSTPRHDHDHVCGPDCDHDDHDHTIMDPRMTTIMITTITARLADPRRDGASRSRCAAARWTRRSSSPGSRRSPRWRGRTSCA
jgi:G3E family GTPase